MADRDELKATFEQPGRALPHRWKAAVGEAYQTDFATTASETFTPLDPRKREGTTHYSSQRAVGQEPSLVATPAAL